MISEQETLTNEKGKAQNELIHHRLTWLGVFEGLLFVANSSSANRHPFLLPLFGFAIAISIWAGTSAANKALDDLHRNVKGWRRFVMPGAFIPPAFAVVWLIILTENFWGRLVSFIRTAI